jgi:hypothetical protein
VRQTAEIRAGAFFLNALVPFTRIWVVAGGDTSIPGFFTIGAARDRADTVYRGDHKKTANHNRQDKKLSIKFQICSFKHSFLLF